MKLLLDANLSWRLVKPLSNHFPEISHILDYFSHNVSDQRIWAHARSGQYIIVTNDDDFASLLMDFGWPPKIILLKTGNQSNDYLLQLLVEKKQEIESFALDEQTGMLVIR